MDSGGEIFFRCTACRRRLAADPRAVGDLVNCPNCQSSLRVPESSTAMDPLRVRRRLVTAFVASGFLACGLAGWGLAQRGAGTHPIATATTPRASAFGTNAISESAQRVQSRVFAANESAGLPRARSGEEQRAFQQLQQEHRAVSRQYEDLANWVLGNLRGRFLLKQQHVRKLRFEPVNEDFSVNPELAEFLVVNTNESSVMSDVLQYSRHALLGLQQAYLSATQDTSDRVTIYIPPFEREGAVVREELYGALQGVLGSDRFNRLLDVSEKDLARSYDYFGAASRTLVFEAVSDPSVSATPYLIIKDGWVIPQDESRRTTETSEEAVTELPARYNSYLAWLPDFIAAYAKP